MAFRVPEERAYAASVVQRVEPLFSSTKRGGSTYLPLTDSHDLAVPLRPTANVQWRPHTTALCLHCTEPCLKEPLPIVMAKATDGRYSLLWYFCRPCCGLRYIREHNMPQAPLLEAWTRDLYAARGYAEPLDALAFPRKSLSKFRDASDGDEGVNLATFYGEDLARTTFVEELSPPLASYAMYLECVKRRVGEAAAGRARPSTVDAEAAAIIPLAPLPSVRDLKRPTERSVPIALPQPTGAVPLLLEFLVQQVEKGAQPPPPRELATPIKSKPLRAKKPSPARPRVGDKTKRKDKSASPSSSTESADASDASEKPEEGKVSKVSVTKRKRPQL